MESVLQSVLVDIYNYCHRNKQLVRRQMSVDSIDQYAAVLSRQSSSSSEMSEIIHYEDIFHPETIKPPVQPYSPVSNSPLTPDPNAIPKFDFNAILGKNGPPKKAKVDSADPVSSDQSSSNETANQSAQGNSASSTDGKLSKHLTKKSATSVQRTQAFKRQDNVNSPNSKALALSSSSSSSNKRSRFTVSKIFDSIGHISADIGSKLTQMPTLRKQNSKEKTEVPASASKDPEPFNPEPQTQTTELTTFIESIPISETNDDIIALNQCSTQSESAEKQTFSSSVLSLSIASDPTDSMVSPDSTVASDSTLSGESLDQAQVDNPVDSLSNDVEKTTVDAALSHSDSVSCAVSSTTSSLLETLPHPETHKKESSDSVEDTCIFTVADPPFSSSLLDKSDTQMTLNMNVEDCGSCLSSLDDTPPSSSQSESSLESKSYHQNISMNSTNSELDHSSELVSNDREVVPDSNIECTISNFNTSYESNMKELEESGDLDESPVEDTDSHESSLALSSDESDVLDESISFDACDSCSNDSDIDSSQQDIPGNAAANVLDMQFQTKPLISSEASDNDVSNPQASVEVFCESITNPTLTLSLKSSPVTSSLADEDVSGSPVPSVTELVNQVDTDSSVLDSQLDVALDTDADVSTTLDVDVSTENDSGCLLGNEEEYDISSSSSVFSSVSSVESINNELTNQQVGHSLKSGEFTSPLIQVESSTDKTSTKINLFSENGLTESNSTEDSLFEVEKLVDSENCESSIESRGTICLDGKEKFVGESNGFAVVPGLQGEFLFFKDMQ